jgi:ATP-dependent Clp protease ATP-binding subunit ClpC
LENYFFEAKYSKYLDSNATLLLCILRNENDPTTKLLNKLKIDYDIAKEQYLNMTPNEEDFIENSRNESYNDDSGQDDSLKESSFNNPNKSNKNQNSSFR